MTLQIQQQEAVPIQAYLAKNSLPLNTIQGEIRSKTQGLGCPEYCYIQSDP